MSDIVPITVAYGDGIGPEIVETTLNILREAKARIRIEVIEVGEKLYKKNYSSGIAEDTWESLERTKILLKGPITTPQGGGYKSLNVTMRKTLGLFANIRPVKSYHPFIYTNHPKMDLVIVRENEEDLYAGIEYRHTPNVYKSLKLISAPGSERIIRYAFEYALKNNRKKVTCFSKDNIMKFSDGIFHKIFDQVAKEYPQLTSNHYIIDIGTARLANSPEDFDVIVTSNLYGDIISDVAAEVSGSVGLAGSSNIGEKYAMFEAVHGSAPDIAGKDIANPSGIINAALMMLVHIGQSDVAALIGNALHKTIEDGIHTADIYEESKSKKRASTTEFGAAIIERLGQKPASLPVISYPNTQSSNKSISSLYDVFEGKKVHKKLVGVDVFIDYAADSADHIAHKLSKLNHPAFKLHTVSAKGLKAWPTYKPFNIISDHWCCRFMNTIDAVDYSHVVSLLEKVQAEFGFVSVENLYEFDGTQGFTLAQGE